MKTAPWGAALSTQQKNLVHLRRQLHCAQTFVVALAGRGVLALALGRWLFVGLTGAQFGEEARFFDGAFEAAQCNFERFVFAEFDDHVCFAIKCAGFKFSTFLLSSLVI